MKKRIGAIIQARLGSSRFPRKMLADLGGYSIMEWVVTRVLKSQTLDEVIVATTNQSQDDPLVDFLKKFPVKVFRGDENNVLKRFLDCASEFNLDTIVRICADNPFIAFEEIDRLSKQFSDSDADYAFNHIPKLNNLYPDGLGAEIFDKTLLKSIVQKADLETRHLEHVTSYIWDNADQFSILSIKSPTEIQTHDSIKLDIDTQEDLLKMKKLSQHLNILSTAQEVVQAWRKTFT